MSSSQDPDANSFLWIGPEGGDWQTGSNWSDPTAGIIGIVPAPADTVTLGNGAYVTGIGAAATADLMAASALVVVPGVFPRPITLDGSFNFGLLTLAQSGEGLTIGSGSTIVAGTFDSGTFLGGGILASGATVVAGTLTGGAFISAENGAQLAFSTIAPGEFFEADATSSIELGATGGAGPGTLQVATGQTISFSSASAPVIDVEGLLLPAFFASLEGTLTGSGTITAATIGTVKGTWLPSLSIFAVATDSRVTIEAGTSTALALPNDMPASMQIDFSGTSHELEVAGSLTVAATIDGLTPGDSILGQTAGPAASATFVAGAGDTGTLDIADAEGTIVGTLALAGDDSADRFAVVATGDSADITVTVPCFAAGTGIATPSGPVAVECLTIGQSILLADGARGTVRWLGHRRVDCRRHDRPDLVWPVRIAPDAFAPGRPARALFLSPDHAVFADGLLVPIKHLINGTSIAQVPTPSITYWHVELDRHAVLLAENLPCETYLDTGNRHAFANARVIMLQPDFSPRRRAEACAPRVEARPELVGLKRRLFRAAGLPDRKPPLALALRTGSRDLPPRAIQGDRWVFDLPPRTRRLRLRSPAWVPAACLADALDRRQLGIRVFDIQLDAHPVPLSAPELASGFHPAEETTEGRCRWTDGDATLLLPPRTRRLTLRIDDDASPWSPDQPVTPGRSPAAGTPAARSRASGRAASRASA